MFLDVDWEYPALNGGKPEDKENFVELLKVIIALIVNYLQNL